MGNDAKINNVLSSNWRNEDEKSYIKRVEYDRKLDERFNNKGIEKQEIFDKEMDDRISVTDVVVEIDKKNQ